MPKNDEAFIMIYLLYHFSRVCVRAFVWYCDCVCACTARWSQTCRIRGKLIRRARRFWSATSWTLRHRRVLRGTACPWTAARKSAGSLPLRTASYPITKAARTTNALRTTLRKGCMDKVRYKLDGKLTWIHFILFFLHSNRWKFVFTFGQAQEETAARSLLARTGVRTRTPLRAAEVPDCPRARAASHNAAPDGDPGQDMVPEPSLQEQATADRAGEVFSEGPPR